MNSLSLKAKLSLLIGIAILALLIVAGVGLVGVRTGTNALHEVGNVRLPSVLGLEIVNEGQTAVRSNNLSTAIWENDYQAQANFKKVVETRKEIWARIGKGWKIYEPLPQTKEEEILWNQFVKDWDIWKGWQQKRNRAKAIVRELL